MNNKYTIKKARNFKVELNGAIIKVKSAKEIKISIPNYDAAAIASFGEMMDDYNEHMCDNYNHLFNNICPEGGDVTNDCEHCSYSGDFHYDTDTETCTLREDTPLKSVSEILEDTQKEVTEQDKELVDVYLKSMGVEIDHTNDQTYDVTRDTSTLKDVPKLDDKFSFASASWDEINNLFKKYEKNPYDIVSEIKKGDKKSIKMSEGSVFVLEVDYAGVHSFNNVIYNHINTVPSQISLNCIKIKVNSIMSKFTDYNTEQLEIDTYQKQHCDDTRKYIINNFPEELQNMLVLNIDGECLFHINLSINGKYAMFDLYAYITDKDSVTELKTGANTSSFSSCSIEELRNLLDKITKLSSSKELYELPIKVGDTRCYYKSKYPELLYDNIIVVKGHIAHAIEVDIYKEIIPANISDADIDELVEVFRENMTELVPKEILDIMALHSGDEKYIIEKRKVFDVNNDKCMLVYSGYLYHDNDGKHYYKTPYNLTQSIDTKIDSEFSKVDVKDMSKFIHRHMTNNTPLINIGDKRVLSNGYEMIVTGFCTKLLNNFNIQFSNETVEAEIVVPFSIFKDRDIEISKFSVSMLLKTILLEDNVNWLNHICNFELVGGEELPAAIMHSVNINPGNETYALKFCLV